MFRYSIVVVAIALLVPTSVAEGAVPKEKCHVADSDTVGTRSLLQTNGGISYRQHTGILQASNIIQASHMGATGYADKVDDGATLSKAPVDATLDEAGYQEVAALCCADDMMIFIKRVLAAKNYNVCEEGGLSGFVWWFDCPNDQASYTTLVTAIEAATTGDCAWVGVAGQECPEFSEDCKIDDPQPHPACSTATTTPGTLPQLIIEASTTALSIPSSGSCCRRKTALLSTKTAKVSPAASKLLPFDCNKYTGAIQVIKNSQQGGYDVKELDVVTGIYQLLYFIPFTRTTPDFDNLNAVAVNPVDGIAYGLLNFGDKNNAWLVRFDEIAMEFVAKVARFSPAGTFGFQGTFYYLAGGIRSIVNAASLPGFPDQNGNIAQLQDDDPITGQINNFAGFDLAAYVGDLEGGQRQDNYVFSLDKTGKLLVVKDTGAGSKSWIMDTTISGENKGFGAGWSFQGSVYFSSNLGTGVYQIPVTSLNVNQGSVMIKQVGESEKTSSNDGMNCMNLGPPFPPPEEGCGEDFEEVPPEADGTCPSDTFRA